MLGPLERQTSEQRQQVIDNLRSKSSHWNDPDTTPQTAESLSNLNDQIDLARDKLDAVSSITFTYGDFLKRESDIRAEQLGIINNSISYSQQLSEQVRKATVESIADRLHGLQEESRAIQTFLPQLEELAPTSKEAADQLREAQTRLEANWR